MFITKQAEEAPLPFYQVLEEEYQSLYGSLPETYLETRQEVLSSPATSDEDEKKRNETLVSRLYKCISDKQHAALCLSGGGIRSATFGLGVLQGLARRGLLDQFHYLSTVSGGGYIGSWLTSWIHRQVQKNQNGSGLASVVEALQNDPPKSKLTPEPEPIRHLREYSNYLTPQLGLFSADTWTLIATYLRNLLVNWFVWIPLLVLALMLPRFLVAISVLRPDHWWIVGFMLVAGVFVLVTLAYICLYLPSVRKELENYDCLLRDQEGQGSFLKWCLTPLLLSAFCLTTAWAWIRNLEAGAVKQLPLIGGVLTGEPLVVFLAIGVLVHVLGWAMAMGFLLVGKPGKQVPSRRIAICQFWRAYRVFGLSAIIVSGAAGGLTTWALAIKIFPTPSDERHILVYTCLAAPMLLFSFLIAGALYVGLASRRTSDEDREWWARSSAWILIAAVGWIGLNSIVLFLPPLLLEWPAILGSIGGATGLISLLLGYSAKSAATSDEVAKAQWTTVALTLAPIIAAPAALIFIAACLALLTGEVMRIWPDMVTVPAAKPSSYQTVLYHTDGWALVKLAWLLILIVIPMSIFTNVNKFSLHSLYRNRLIRAYLGASNEARNPNAFTGFDPEDNIEMYKLAPQAPSPTSSPRLLHVVNIALNLVGKSKERLAWQERKAESFTVTPLHVGNWQLGYRRAEDYGKSKKGGSIKLGTAIGISGAAASPNMGYHSSSVVTLLMTLFNVRLGWWLGNPGKAGDKTFSKASPQFSIVPMIYEALGLTNDDYKYVYLSDGGHFENLGLYEMVLRHCRFILAIDSGRDPEGAFDDLGNAIRKIRIDLGIPITLQKVRIYPPENKRKKTAVDIPKYCAIGTIKYSELDSANPEPDGVLIYIKPALCDDDEPMDIFNYAQANPGFPHESTGDQWFSESQFESYRMLGSHIIQQICGKDLWKDRWKKDVETHKLTPLELFHQQVEDYLNITNIPPSNGKPPWRRHTGIRTDPKRPKTEKV
ncbi:MAG TPA: patatin-like phospholipase family protein [Nitrospiraceae bacterium]|nr:patatin-like phospholipase family protein [Nitrospiraceae bacterium]